MTPTDSMLGKAVVEHLENIQQATGTPLYLNETPNGEIILAESSDTIKNAQIEVNLIPQTNQAMCLIIPNI